MMVNVNAEKLQNERVSKGISRYKLSLLSGLASNAVFRMETKKQKVSFVRLQAVANALNCDVNKLIDKKN